MKMLSRVRYEGVDATVVDMNGDWVLIELDAGNGMPMWLNPTRAARLVYL